MKKTVKEENQDVFGEVFYISLKNLFGLIKGMIVFIINGFIKIRYLKLKDLISVLIFVVITLTVTNKLNTPTRIKPYICIISVILWTSLLYFMDKSQMYKIFLQIFMYRKKIDKVDYPLYRKYFYKKFKFFYLKPAKFTDNDMMLCRINSFIPLPKVISRLTFLSQMSKFNIIDIEEKKYFLGKLKCINIHLSKKQTTPYKLRLLEKLTTSLYLHINDISKIEFKETLTQYLIEFDSEELYKKMKSFEDEFTFRCKLKENELVVKSHYEKDYQIIIKKFFKKEKDFIKLYEQNKDLLNKQKIGWLAGYDEKEGNFNIFDIQKFNHLLLGGTTGSGKSNVLHTILLSILLNDKEVEIIICDPKINDFKDYRQFKNVKFYSDFEDIVNVVKEQYKEAESRNKIIENDDFVRNIETYNSKYTVKQIKYRVILIDEIADIILNPEKKLSDEFTDYVSKLAQKSRSVGIRLILATQNPTKEVLQKFIKPNLNTRIALMVTNKVDSRTILDNNLASEIGIPGKFVLQNQGKNEFYFSPYIPDNGLGEVINYIKEHSHIYYEKNDKNLELINDKVGLREKISQGERVEIDNSKTLYNFYINLQQTNNILPVKKEIQDYTNLSDHKLRRFNDELKKQGLLQLIDNQKLKVVDIDNELEVKRLQKKENS